MGEPYVCVGEGGALRLNSHVLDIMGNGFVRSESFHEDTVTAELADFANAIQQSTSGLSTPLEAVQDVAVIEAMFESAQSGHIVRPATIM